MNKKVPIFIPVEQFIPQEYKQLPQKPSTKSIFNEEISSRNNDNKDIQQLKIIPKKSIYTYQNPQGRSKTEVNDTEQNSDNFLFNEDDFIVSEDNTENSIETNLRSLDMKKYSDRNNYFNSSIQKFNLQKNIMITPKTNENNQLNQKNNKHSGIFKSNPSIQNIKLNDNNQIVIKQNSQLDIYQIESQQSTYFTNASQLSNQLSSAKQNYQEYIPKQNAVNYDSSTQIINDNKNKVNMLNLRSPKSLTNKINQNNDSQQCNRIMHSQITKTDYRNQDFDIDSQKMNKHKKIFNDICQGQKNIISQNTIYSYNINNENENTSNQIKCFANLQEQNNNIIPKQNQFKNIQTQQQLQQVKKLMIQIKDTNQENQYINENNRIQNKKQIEMDNSYNQCDMDESNIEESIVDAKSDQSRKNIGQQIQNNQILNNNFNIFVVKKNRNSPISKSINDLNSLKKFSFFNKQNDDQKIQDADTSTKNVSCNNVQSSFDFENINSKNQNKKVNILTTEDEKYDNFFDCDQINNQQNNAVHIKQPAIDVNHVKQESIKNLNLVQNNQLPNLDIQNNLIQSIFENNKSKLQNLLKGYSNQQLNSTDANGNTLLYVSTKLSLLDDKNFEIFKYLLQSGANPKIRNKEGWSPLDEVINAKNVKLTTILFEYIYQVKLKKIQDSILQLEQILSTIPDYYIEIKWHFESMIPFLGYFAPSDTFKFWKVGNSFRLDTTLVGFSNLKCKRRNMSLIYKNQQIQLINKSNKTITNPQEPLDPEEKKMIIQDLLSSKPFQSSFDVTQCTVQQCKTWNGKPTKKKISNYNAEQYKMNLVYEYLLKKKSKIEDQHYQSYKKYKQQNQENQTLITDKRQPTQRSTSRNKETQSASNILNKETKKTNLNIWMTKEYPIHFKQFLPVLQALERSNPMLQKLNEFLNIEQVKNLVLNEGFPVKIQIPINYTIKSTIDFSDFRFISESSTELSNLFNIDSTFEVIPRKIAQKTLQRAKKRMILANMITA